MHPQQRTALYLALFGVVWSILIHLVEFQVTGNWVHATADDPSYLRPAENFIDHGVWKENFDGPSAYVQRPPLVGVQHGVFYAIAGKNAPYLSSVLAILLHGIAIYLLFVMLNGVLSRKKTVCATLLFILLPAFWGFLTYQIAEAYAVSILIVLIYILTRETANVAHLIIAVFVLWLFRPILILLVLPAVFPLIKKAQQRISIKTLVFLLVGLISVCGWEIRKAHFVSWPNAHPIYSSRNQTMFRPAHEKLSNLFRIWEYKAEEFHAVAGSLWSGDSTFLNPEKIEELRIRRSVPLSIADLTQLFQSYARAAAEVRLHRPKFETTAEKSFGELAERTTRQLKKTHWQLYWLVTPARSALHVLSKSQLNLTIFQKTFRGNPVIEVMRLGMLVLIATGLLCLIIQLFLPSNFRWLYIGAILYMCYLFWIQRLNEDRYGVVLLPVFLIAIFTIVQYFTTRRTGKIRKE